MSDVARSVEVFMSIILIALGLSFVLRPEAWKEFLSRHHARGPSGSLTFGFLGMGMGSFIVAFHNIWGGVPTILTVCGWAALAKGAVYLLFPELGVKRLTAGLKFGAGLWRTGGVLYVVLGLVVLQYALRS